MQKNAKDEKKTSKAIEEKNNNKSEIHIDCNCLRETLLFNFHIRILWFLFSTVVPIERRTWNDEGSRILYVCTYNAFMLAEDKSFNICVFARPSILDRLHWPALVSQWIAIMLIKASAFHIFPREFQLWRNQGKTYAVHKVLSPVKWLPI